MIERLHCQSQSLAAIEALSALHGPNESEKNSSNLVPTDDEVLVIAKSAVNMSRSV